VLYDPDTNTYEVLELEVRPSPRARTGFAHDPVRGVFVLFGGVQGQRSQRDDDLWVFDPRVRRWGEVPRGCNRPSERGGNYGMANDELEDSFVLTHGRSAFDLWLDETVALRLDDTAPGRARYVFDRSGFPDGATWFAEVETPAGAEVRFRFASSADGRRFTGALDACPAEGRFVQVEVTLVPGADAAGPTVRALGFR
jgi:hypothetical protein